MLGQPDLSMVGGVGRAEGRAERVQEGAVEHALVRLAQSEVGRGLAVLALEALVGGHDLVHAAHLVGVRVGVRVKDQWFG